jgi:hypothetical protein
MAMYDLAALNRKSDKKESSKKRAFKHQLCKALISRRGISASGSDRNVWIRIPPLISRLPAASKKMNELILMDMTSTRPKVALSPMVTPQQSSMHATFNISAVTPGIHHEVADFESFLNKTIDLGSTLNPSRSSMNIDGETVDNEEVNKMLDCFTRDDSSSLTFERCLNEQLFDEYKVLTHSPNLLLTHSPNLLLTHSPNLLLTHSLT